MFGRILAVVVLALMLLPTPADASHSMAGGAACGTYRYDAVAEMTKGRTDGMVVSADHSVGCMRYVYRNLVGTGIGEGYGYGGQAANCVRVGQVDVASFYRYYFDHDIDPGSVKVTCSAYGGPD